MSAQQAIEDDQRRARRDDWQRGGGSKRRPLRSFLTDAEKRSLRDDHAARLRLAVEEVQTPAGFAAWAESLTLNPHLSPMNAALVALQTPGEVAASVAGWKRLGYRVKKGETLAGRITAPGFWPLPYFCAVQAGASELDDLAPPLPSRAGCERLRTALVAALSSEVKQRIALEAIAAKVAALPRDRGTTGAVVAEPLELFA